MDLPILLFLVFPASFIFMTGSLDQKYMLCRGEGREGIRTFIIIISFESYKQYKVNDITVVTSVEETKPLQCNIVQS